ncbi:MAG: S8 family serine peptidase, partial [Candidatus Eisenbacteria bacterium]|nr:S8 family serine peptidase [Candidatus Eisenbacteria bacterium]
MRSPSLRAVTGLLLNTAAVAAWAMAPAPGSSSTPDAKWVPGELLVQIATDAVHSSQYRSDLGSMGRTGLGAIDQQLSAIGAFDIMPVFDAGTDPTARAAAGLDRIFRVRYADAIDPERAAERFSGMGEVSFAEPNYIAHMSLTPNDPTYPSQWAHNNTGQAIRYTGGTVGTADCDTDTDQAWDLQTGSASFILAIVDTGCDTGHPEFAGRVVAGYDYVNNDSNPTDDNGHGTSCAGIALGGGNNAAGIAGVAWNVKLMPVKVLNAAGSGAYTGVASGITFAADNGAKILSLSLGGPASSTLQVAVDYAVNTRGCAMFAATGNGNASSLDYPAAYSNVISVGALSPCNERKSPTSCDAENWWGSNYGTGIDFMAPGVRIHTTDIRGTGGFGSGDYITDFNGTSSATPHAAGIGALVWSQNPALTRTTLLSVLQTNCDDLGTAGYDTQTGYGRLNAFLAVQNASGGGGGGGGTPVTLFSEDFETNVVPGTVWGANDANGTSGADYWGDQSSGSGARVHGGSWSAYCADNSNVAGQTYDHNMTAYMTKTASVSLSGVTNVTFSFWLWNRTSNASDYLAFQYWNGTAWVEQQRWSGTGTGAWVQATYNLTGFTTFQWRWLFFSNGSSRTEGAYIDDIVLAGVTTAAPPQPAAMALTLIDERSEPDMTSMLRNDMSSVKGNPVELISISPVENGKLVASPNPMTSGTTLRFALPAQAAVSLEVFSADGRRVAIAHQGAFAAGTHSVNWDGRGQDGSPLAGGVYWARLVVDGTLSDVS